MTRTEPDLERIIAAARGIPAPPSPGIHVSLGQRLNYLATWVRFWHERPNRSASVGLEQSGRLSRD